jgi:hypothetical protein
VFIGKNVGGMFDNPYFEDGVRRSVIIGSHAGVTNHGDDNTFVGEGSGFHNIHGGGNVFVGRASGYWNNSGGRNTCLGVESGPEYVYPDTPSDCVLLGYGASSLLSNRLVISNANATLIDGDFETGQVHVGSAGGLLGTLYVGAIVDPSLVLGPSSEWYIGKDDSDADKLKIGTGHTVGSGIKLSIASNGIVRAGGNASGSDSSYVILNESLRGLKAVSTDSVGVFGKSTDGIGVKAVSTRNYGLHATSTDQEAVVGISTNDRAVYGKSTNSYSGYFDGSVMVVGYLSKGGGSFLIDHPLDPENKLLRHNFVESPENLLIYRGKVKLDGKGEAAVTLPDYFAALTKESDATVNLTSIGRPFSAGYDWASDHVSFTVYGEAHREVAWMVMADRDDPVIRQLGAPVEERKIEGSKTCTPGRLLYPTAFGYPESKGMGYEERQALEGTD